MYSYEYLYIPCLHSVCQAVKQLLELPLNLTIVSPAHTPNWDLVSDVVNSCSRIYRSPKQCRNRYENVIIPREEGKVMDRATLLCCKSDLLTLYFFGLAMSITFFSWCMRQTPRRKPRAYTRYLKWPLYLMNVSVLLNLWAHFCCFFVSCLVTQSKNSRPLRTCQIYTQDDNATHIQLYNSRFELMKIIASKRSPPIKPL